MTAVVGSAAEDTTPSEREAPQRFAWWHPRSADLGRHKARREEHARRNDLWARPAAQEEAPVIRRPLPPPSASCVFAVIDGPVFAPVDPPTRHAPAAPHSSTKSDEAIAKALQEEAPKRRGRGLEMRRVGDAAWRPFASQKDAATDHNGRRASRSPFVSWTIWIT